MENFFGFNERSSIWTKIFKVYTIVMFWLFVIAGFILCCLGWDERFIITDSSFLDGIIVFGCGCFLAFTQAVVNMLILQLLNNIQLIREKIEKM